MKRRLLAPALRASLFLLLALLALLRLQSLRGGEPQAAAVEQFQGSSALRYIQLSCYWDEPQPALSIARARQAVEAELTQIYETLPAIKMAWGTLRTGVAEVGAHSCEAEIYAVSEDFFAIHPLPQCTGSYRNPAGTGAVLNEAAAFQLFGSSDCIGLSFQLEGSAWLVQSVCQTPEQSAQIYLPGTAEAASFFELLLPEPWTGFGESLLSGIPALNSAVIRNNSTRLGAGPLFAAAREALTGSASPAAIRFPSWEYRMQRTALHLQLTWCLLLAAVLHALAAVIQGIWLVLAHKKNASRQLQPV